MKNQDKPHSKKNNWLVLLILLTGSLFMVEQNYANLLTSVIPTKTAPAYDGTALPILKAPIWTSLTSSEYRLSYDAMPTSKMGALPTYDANVLRTPTEQLGWKTASDLNTRNAKITFSVPYMGNYKLDGQENAGSHLAVDIKIPDNTPVYAIGNGVVVKVSEQTTGFGKHIVIKHDGFPSFDNPTVKATYYSAYNHLNEILVAEGDVVLKGQLIAKSGHTGTATTPHLHFQIDNDKAPWHPYWPFTYQEYSAAGLTFNGAIDAGLGKDKALQTTINPMVYVQKYLNYAGSTSISTSTSTYQPTSTVSGSTSTVSGSTSIGSGSTTSGSGSTTTGTSTTTSGSAVSQPATSTPAVSELPPELPASNTQGTTTVNSVNNSQAIEPSNTTTTETSNVSSTTSNTPEYTNYANEFRLRTESDQFVAETKQTMTIEALNSNGDIIKNYRPKDGIYPQVILGSADVPSVIRPSEFINGKASFEFTPHTQYGLQIRVSDGQTTADGKILQSVLFKDVDTDSEAFKAVSFLKKYKVLAGYPDGTFKPANIVSRVEALKFVLEASQATLTASANLPFKDTSSTEWYSTYVATAYKSQIIDGYPDKSFKPSNSVNRAEFLKMLLTSMKFKVNPYVTRDVFNDVKKDAWYASYVKFAKDKNLVDIRGHYFKPEEGMTREDVAKLLYRAILLKVSGGDKFETTMEVAEGQLSKYFS